MKNSYILLGAFVVIAGVIALAWLSAPIKTSQPVACTMEVKLCSDGSTVGRSGPNCEFADCPAIKKPPLGVAPGDITLSVGEKKEVKGITLTVNKLVQDSRCPQFVKCIWEGALIANVTFAAAGKIEATELTLGKESYPFNGYVISMVSATPTVKKLSENVPESAYTFTFRVVPLVE